MREVLKMDLEQASASIDALIEKRSKVKEKANAEEELREGIAGEGEGMPKCEATRADGTPCERLIDASAIYCYSHDADRAEQRRRNAAKAGRGKGPAGDLLEVKHQLRTIADDVLKGDLDRGSASVAAQVLGVYIRAVEQERRIREQDELLERLNLLEEAQKKGERSLWGA
jgi:hypothetical protein